MNNYKKVSSAKSTEKNIERLSIADRVEYMSRIHLPILELIFVFSYALVAAAIHFVS